MYKKVKYSTGTFMQYGWVWTKNIQQSRIKMTHLYCMSNSDWFALFLPWLHPYLGAFKEMVINLKPRYEKLNNVDQSNFKSQMPTKCFMTKSWVVSYWRLLRALLTPISLHHFKVTLCQFLLTADTSKIQSDFWLQLDVHSGLHQLLFPY